MKKRLFSNWTFVRAVYLVLGTLILMQAIITHQWLGILLGGYLASMGLFAFGCAAGNCSVDIDKKE
ncbi:MAG TPA: hypothetical protein PLL00_11175 [Bacteroidia bacterium]|jgi:hypothetical protein|nr:hypothetical protein [Bacteroidia bacterium]